MVLLKETTKVPPPEILIMIMQHMSSPKDLMSFLLASSTFSNTFELSKASILSNVARNSFHPAIFPLAVTVCTARQELPISARRKEWEKAQERGEFTKYQYGEFHRRRVRKYLDLMEYEATLARDVDSLRCCILTDSSKTITTSLCRLWNLLDYCIRSYHRCGIEKNCKPRSCVSDEEYVRLQRAFLIFELYATIFRGADLREWYVEIRDYHPTIEDESLTRPGEDDEFLERAGEQARAELWSIHCYLNAHIARILDSVYTYVIAHLDKTSKYGIRYNRPKIHDLNKLKAYEQLLKDRILGYQERTANSISELGLSFCAKLFRMQVREQVATFFELHNTGYHTVISYFSWDVSNYDRFSAMQNRKAPTYLQDAFAVLCRRNSSSAAANIRKEDSVQVYGKSGYFLLDDETSINLSFCNSAYYQIHRLRTNSAARRTIKEIKKCKVNSRAFVETLPPSIDKNNGMEAIYYY